MDEGKKDQKLTSQQQRVLKLLFKFRFVSSGLLADVMSIRKFSVYEVLEKLASRKLVAKVYESKFRIDRRPAYYYLSKSGVTAVRKLLNVEESVVHALYKNDEMTDDFVSHCMKLVQCYISIRQHLPEGSDIFSKSEINRFDQFPKNRPDLYVRTPDGKDAIVVLVDDKPLYIARKRLEEVIAHSEDGEWEGDIYPRVCFIVKNETAKRSFLAAANKKLESMGIEEDELCIVAAKLVDFEKTDADIWSSCYKPKKQSSLFN